MPRLASVKVILFLTLLLVLDQAVLSAFQIKGISPSFLYLFVCYASFEWERKKTLPVAFFVGLGRDFVAGGILGPQAVIFVVFAAFLDQAVQRIEREFPGIYFLLTYAFVFLCEFTRFLFDVFSGDLRGIAGECFGGLLAFCTYTSALLPIFYWLASLWFGSSRYSRQYELFK